MRRTGWAVLVALVALSMTACEIQPNDNTLPGQVAVGNDGMTVTVHFDQVENLVSNSTVQMDNVVIGTVTSIDVSDWEAKVTMRLLRDVPIPADAVFTIGQKTLLGAQYVEVTAQLPGKETKDAIRPVSAAMLKPGDVVPVGQTGSYPSTEQVLGGVALLLNNGGLAQISTITGELSAVLRDRVPDTRSLIRQTNRLLAALDGNRADVVRALTSLEDLSEGLAEDKDLLTEALTKIAPGLASLERQRENLITAVDATGETGARATRLIRASRTALLSNLDQLGPILDELSSVSTSIPEALKIGITIPFPAMTTHEAIKGDYANLFVALDLTTDSLLGSWLGGGTPATMGGDPVRDPLTVRPRTEPPGKPATPGNPATPGSNTKPPTPSATADPEPAPKPKSTCLLAFLGVC